LEERRLLKFSDRRGAARGGRRMYDRSGRCPVVLVAEGYDEARQVFVRYLQRFGFRVEEAATLEQAATIAHRSRPKVLLCDLSLSHGGPLTSMAELASPESGATMIGLVNLDVAERPQGVATILVKPFRLRAMLEEVRSALRAGGQVEQVEPFAGGAGFGPRVKKAT
jgi:DNA-binding response OmpR family regulator